MKRTSACYARGVSERSFTLFVLGAAALAALAALAWTWRASQDPRPEPVVAPTPQAHPSEQSAAPERSRPPDEVSAMFRSLRGILRHSDALRETTLVDLDLTPLRAFVLEHALTSEEVTAAAVQTGSYELPVVLLALAWTEGPVDFRRLSTYLDGFDELGGQGSLQSRCALAHALVIRGDRAGASAHLAELLLGVSDFDRYRGSGRYAACILLRGLDAVNEHEIRGLVLRLTDPASATMGLTKEAWALAASARSGLHALDDEASLPDLEALLRSGGEDVPYSRYLASDAAAALLATGTPLSMDVAAAHLRAGGEPRTLVLQALTGATNAAAVGALLRLRADLAGDEAALAAIDACIERSVRTVDWMPAAAENRAAMVRSLRATLDALPAGCDERARAEELLAHSE